MRQRDNLAEMIRLYKEEELTYAQIGERFGISRQRVHQILSGAGVERRPKKSEMTFERDLLFRLYVEEKRSIVEIASKLAANKIAVRKELIRHGIKLRSPKKLIHLDRDELYRLYVVEGLFQTKVAAKLGISLEIVARELRRHRIKFRHPPGIPLPPSFDPKMLRRLYVDKELTAAEVAEKLGVSPRTILNHLEHQGIKRRKPIKRPKVRTLR